MRAHLSRNLVVSTSAAALTAVALTLAGCGGSGASPSASSPSAAATTATSPPAPPSPAPTATTPSPGTVRPAAAPPAGYQWVGISSQRIWLAVPDSWVVINLSSSSLNSALRKVSVKGLSASALKSVLTNLRQHHALFLADVQSASTSPNKFATNANAFCNPTDVEPGPGAAGAFESALRGEYAKLNAQVISIKDTTAGDTLTIRAEIKLQTAGGYPLTELQFVQLTNRSEVCQTTLSTDNPAHYLPVFDKVGRTIQAG